MSGRGSKRKATHHKDSVYFFPKPKKTNRRKSIPGLKHGFFLSGERYKVNCNEIKCNSLSTIC